MAIFYGFYFVVLVFLEWVFVGLLSLQFLSLLDQAKILLQRFSQIYIFCTASGFAVRIFWMTVVISDSSTAGVSKPLFVMIFLASSPVLSISSMTSLSWLSKIFSSSVILRNSINCCCEKGSWSISMKFSLR